MVKITKEARIKAEYQRLAKIYADMASDQRQSMDGIIRRAAYMRVTLEDYEADLDKKGYVEMFTQSPNTPPYERERPVARLYNAMIKNYKSVVDALSDKLGKIEGTDDDGFENFTADRED